MTVNAYFIYHYNKKLELNLPKYNLFISRNLRIFKVGKARNKDKNKDLKGAGMR